MINFLIGANCKTQSEISFPIDVGTKPKSITKGFNDNYYVTVMNGKEHSHGEVIEISKNGVTTFSKEFDKPKGIIFLKDHLYFSDLNRVWKVGKNGNAAVFVNAEDFPKVK